MDNIFATYKQSGGQLVYVKRSGHHYRIEVFNPATAKAVLMESRRYLKATKAQDALDQMANAKEWRFVRFQNEDDVKDLLKYGGGAK